MSDHEPLAPNYKHIWLEPLCCVDERSWCEDPQPCDDCGLPAIKYVRADLVPVPAQEWQDISTAPKDGTPILIWEPGPHSFGNREQDREYGPDGNFTGVIREYDDKRWAIGYWRPWGGWGNRNSHDVNPTHWQPLPAGPLIADHRDTK